MKIKAIDIYGFGKLENVQMDFSTPQAQVIYGKNEAGKSTIMAFIHAILFGFPAKNQADLRYEPKKGFKYGGKLTIETNDNRIVTIERVAGKAAGDVAVTDDFGNKYELEEVLEGMDKSIYKGIFSCSIMDIQNLKLIDPNQLGGYLFSSGLIGSDHLHQISQQIARELDERFKPNGRKPIINQLLGELKNEEKAVQQWKQKMAEYERLHEEIKCYEQQIEKIETERSSLVNDVRRLEAMHAMQPIYDQIKLIQIQISNLGEYRAFPADGMTRLEKWVAEQTIYQTKCEKLMQDIRQRKKELSEMAVDKNLLRIEEEFNSLLTERHKYEQAKEHAALLKTEKNNVEKRIQAWKADLNWHSHTKDDILAFDSSLSSKSIIRELVQSEHQLTVQKNKLDEQFQQAKEELELQEERILSLEKEQLPSQELQKLQKAVQEQSTGSLEKEIIVQEQLRNQLVSQIGYQFENQKQEKKKKQLGLIISLLIGLAGGIALFLQKYPLFALLFFVATAAIGAIGFFIGKQNTLLEKLQKDREEIEKNLDILKGRFYSHSENSKIAECRSALAKEEQITQLLQKERLMLNQYERVYNSIIRQFEVWEKDCFSQQAKWQKWMEKMGFDEIPPSSLEEAYEKAVQLKASVNEAFALQKKMAHYQSISEIFEEKLRNLAGSLSYSCTSPDEMLYYLTIKIQENKQKQHDFQEIEKKNSQLEDEHKLYLIQLQEIEKQITYLLKQAKAETEEDFRAKNEIYIEGTKLKQKRLLLQAQLEQMETSYGFTLKKGSTSERWLSEKSTLEEKLKGAEEELQSLFESHTRSKEMIRTLEEGGTYSDALQQFELSRSKLHEEARRWAVFATAQQLLGKTMDYYRTVKLPEVLERASSYFSFLTGKNYARVYDSTNARKLMVEHKDGLSFEPKELSQATVEQLYIALRFAVASVWSKQQRFPFIMDDAFVNFDRNRTELAAKLVGELAEQGEQILFFTCHDHMKTLFEKDERAKVLTMEQADLFIS